MSDALPGGPNVVAEDLPDTKGRSEFVIVSPAFRLSRGPTLTMAEVEEKHRANDDISQSCNSTCAIRHDAYRRG